MAVTAYDPMATDPMLSDLDFDSEVVDPDVMAPDASSLDPADPAAIDEQSRWGSIFRELRSVQAELEDLRREVRALRNQQSEHR